MKENFEGYGIMLDLNSAGMMNFRTRGAPASRETFFGIEDITEILIYSINTFYLQCVNHKAAFLVFDESRSQLIFPLNDEDDEFVSLFDFGAIKRTILQRILNFLDRKVSTSSRRSYLIQVLFQGICCQLTSLQLRQQVVQPD